MTRASMTDRKTDRPMSQVRIWSSSRSASLKASAGCTNGDYET